ncbi:MAG TPA: ion transporter [Bacteroidales bacterium]
MKRPEWKEKWYRIIFEADTPSGKFFDVVLLAAIALSVVIVMLDSVSDLHLNYGKFFIAIEWGLTILFTLEYIFRIILVRKPLKYIFSFYGIIDFLAIIPTYVSVFLQGTHFLIIIRILRLLRIFRVLKLMRYMDAANTLKVAMQNSKAKIVVFLEVVLTIVVIVGALMYLIEGPENGFTSIPTSIYWAIVTITTVGYGDIAPQTIIGQTLASFLMITGYAIIAVPTGIITTEMSKAQKLKSVRICSNCMFDEHDENASYCKKCGEKL